MIRDPAPIFRIVPEQASTFASRVDWLIGFLTVTSAGLTLAVFLLVVWFGLRYRRRDENEVPPEAKPIRWLELVCVAGLFGLFMVMFSWGAWLYVFAKRPPADALVIDVIGKQWMWKVRQPGGRREINELHVPVGRPVRLNMISQDVIHSFSVPAFRIKQDVLPGSYSTQWFEANKPGEYHLFCQEYCGSDHSRMRGRVIAMSEADYESWLAAIPPDDPPAAQGQKLMTTYGCFTCHGVLAPSFAGIYNKPQALSDGTTAIADEAYLRESILYPGRKIVAGYAPQMPTYVAQLDEEQVDAMIAYIKSLGTSVSETSPDASAAATRPANGVAPQRLPLIPPTIEPPPVGPIGAPSPEVKGSR